MFKKFLHWIRAFALIAIVISVLMGVGQSAQAAVPQGPAPASVPAAVNGSVSAKIVSAAYGQLGRSQDCTMLVTNSLAAAGIPFHDWPAGYLSLGYTVPASQAVPGDLVYYANGGSGLSHIAVYIGNRQAIHGGWNGSTTVIWSVNVAGGIPPTAYIHVTRMPSGYTAPAPEPVKAAPAPAPAVAPAPAYERAAQVVPVPHSGAKTHLVAPGETLSSIAQAEGLGGWQALWHANPDIANPNLIYAGQTLNVPGGP